MTASGASLALERCPRPRPLPRGDEVVIEIGLDAVIVAVTNETPRILTINLPGPHGTDALALPSGSLDPVGDRTLDLGIRRWVREQTGIELGYIEQLYTYGDRDRLPGTDRRVLSIAYLALVREGAVDGTESPVWRPWYDHFPWEDWRDGRPEVIADEIVPALQAFVAATEAPALAAARRARIEIAFALGEAPWDPNRVLDRYELLYEAGLVSESAAAATATSGSAARWHSTTAASRSPRWNASGASSPTARSCSSCFRRSSRSCSCSASSRPSSACGCTNRTSGALLNRANSSNAPV